MIPAAAGSIFGAPRIPGSAYVSAAASAINYQPRVRRRIEQRLGRSLTDFALESATSFADVLTYALRHWAWISGCGRCCCAKLWRREALGVWGHSNLAVAVLP